MISITYITRVFTNLSRGANNYRKQKNSLPNERHSAQLTGLQGVWNDLHKKKKERKELRTSSHVTQQKKSELTRTRK